MSMLFEPFSCRDMRLPNRIVMAPMTRNFSPNGIPGPDVAEYYRRRAEGDVGLIITEGTVVNRPEARNDPNIPFFHGEKALGGWKQVVDAVHGAGGRIAPQLWHTGLVREQFPDRPRPGEAEGPSGLYRTDKPFGRAMSEADILDTIAAFAQSAKDAVKLGFDCIELHGAHGYLIDQFFWSETNQRDDRWGGNSLPARSRFAVELVRQVREAIGNVPLILRVSQWKQQDYQQRLAPTPAELEAWLRPLVEAGVDLLHCSQRRFWEPEFPELDGEHGLNFAGWVKKLTAAPTISVGSVGLDSDFFSSFRGQQSKSMGLGDLEQRMQRGEFDLIAVGRSLISNPDWAIKVRNGQLDEMHGFTAKDLETLS